MSFSVRRMGVLQLIFILAMCITVNTFAQGGTTGPLTWVLDDETLTISGEGRMPDYDYPDYAPWYEYRIYINNIVIETGVENIGSCAFHGFSVSLYPYTVPVTITIPNSVTEIGDYAFSLCALFSIDIPNSVLNIGNDAFNGCYWLTSLTIPNSVVNIGSHAFCGCIDLKSITLPCNLANIGADAFSFCTGLTKITNFNPVPIVISSNVFYYVDQSVCTLEVPISSISEYEKADVWKNFNIKGIGVGIEEIENENVTIYPNPTIGKLTITNHELRITEIEVFDIYGKQLSSHPHITSSSHHTIDISDLPVGIYFVKIETENGIITKKIIKD